MDGDSPDQGAVFRAVVEHSPDLIARFDRQLRRQYVNPAIERLTGLASSALTGKTLSELNFDPRFSDRIEQAITEVFATGGERTLEVMLPAGSEERVFQARVVPELRSDGSVESVLVISRDITAIRLDATERLRLQKELERANQFAALGRIAAAMSHEFNNLLMGIQPFAELVMKSSNEQRSIDAARQIVESVKRGRGITEGLRAFTSPVPPVRKRVEVRSLLDSWARAMESLVPPAIRFLADIPPGTLAIEAERIQIEQVLTSIVMNARQAIGKAGGTIRVAAQLTADPDRLGSREPFVHISVSDDGPGIAPENLPRIFDPFYTTRGISKGLGLAIARQMVTMHDGQLFVESQPGVGTTAHIFLPEAKS